MKPFIILSICFLIACAASKNTDKPIYEDKNLIVKSIATITYREYSIQVRYRKQTYESFSKEEDRKKLIKEIFEKNFLKDSLKISSIREQMEVNYYGKRYGIYLSKRL